MSYITIKQFHSKQYTLFPLILHTLLLLCLTSLSLLVGSAGRRPFLGV